MDTLFTISRELKIPALELLKSDIDDFSLLVNYCLEKVAGHKKETNSVTEKENDKSFWTAL